MNLYTTKTLIGPHTSESSPLKKLPDQKSNNCTNMKQTNIIIQEVAVGEWIA